MIITKKLQKLITKMENNGYFFDEWESDKNYIKFHYDGEWLPLVFNGIKELTEYVKYVVQG